MFAGSFHHLHSTRAAHTRSTLYYRHTNTRGAASCNHFPDVEISPPCGPYTKSIGRRLYSWLWNDDGIVSACTALRRFLCLPAADSTRTIHAHVHGTHQRHHRQCCLEFDSSSWKLCYRCWLVRFFCSLLPPIVNLFSLHRHPPPCRHGGCVCCTAAGLLQNFLHSPGQRHTHTLGTENEKRQRKRETKRTTTQLNSPVPRRAKTWRFLGF